MPAAEAQSTCVIEVRKRPACHSRRATARIDGMTTSDALTALAGGVLIGAAASGLLVGAGRIAGVSGIVAGILRPRAADTSWRLAFVAGLVAGGIALAVVAPQAFAGPTVTSWPVLVLAGLLVGGGTRVANGCTSGHGVCGLGRRSVRSLVATLTFMTTGAVTVYVVGHVLWRSWW